MTLNQRVKQIQTTSLVFTLIFCMAPNLVEAISKPICPDSYELDMVTYLNSEDCEDPKDFKVTENTLLATEDAETSPQLESLNPSSIAGGAAQVQGPPSIAIDDPNAAGLLAGVIRVGTRDRIYASKLSPYYVSDNNGTTPTSTGDVGVGISPQKKQ